MKIWLSIVLGMVVGVIGTLLGAVISLLIKKSHEKLPLALMAFAGGVMLSIVVFDMIPESYEFSGANTTALSLVFGVVLIGFLQKLLKKQERLSGNEFIRTGLMISGGIALHNLPEGLAVGSGLSDSSYGLGLALLLMVHNIPEGMAMTLPLKMGNAGTPKIVLIAILAGLPTVAGAFAGRIIGNISQDLIGACIGFAAGAMLFVTIHELLPGIFRKGNMPLGIFSALLGVLFGVVMIILI